MVLLLRAARNNSRQNSLIHVFVRVTVQKFGFRESPSPLLSCVSKRGSPVSAFKPAVLALFLAAPALAQPADQPNATPNPTTNRYKEVPGFFKLPPGRQMGASSAVAGDSKGNIWVVDRCAANSCVGSKLDPIMEFDSKGNFVKAFGAGLLQFAHGVTIDRDDHIWVADNVPTDGKGSKTQGHVVLEFDESGKLLRTMGKPGEAGSGPDRFTEPNAVLAAPDGSLFVAEGHTKDY